MQQYTIGQTSKLTGLPPKTIRFYEDEGIITQAKRKENGYRQYEQESIEELKLIKYARDMGLPLGEIRKLLKGCEGGHCKHSKGYIEKSIDDYMEILTQKIEQLTKLKTNLTELRSRLAKNDINCSEGKYCCNIFHQLLDYMNKKGGETNEQTML